MEQLAGGMSLCTPEPVSAFQKQEGFFLAEKKRVHRPQKEENVSSLRITTTNVLKVVDLRVFISVNKINCFIS